VVPQRRFSLLQAINTEGGNLSLICRFSNYSSRALDKVIFGFKLHYKMHKQKQKDKWINL